LPLQERLLPSSQASPVKLLAASLQEPLAGGGSPRSMCARHASPVGAGCRCADGDLSTLGDRDHHVV